MSGAGSMNWNEFILSLCINFSVFLANPLVTWFLPWFIPFIIFSLGIKKNIVIYICILMFCEVFTAAFSTSDNVSEIFNAENFIHYYF
ncbi:hypothetical protein D3C76_1239450 [compost metagenome]